MDMRSKIMRRIAHMTNEDIVITPKYSIVKEKLLSVVEFIIN